MAWVRKDDNAPLHPKSFRGGVAAYGFDDAGICYSNRTLSDGFVPVSDLLLVYPGTPEAEVLRCVEILVREHRWHPHSPDQPAKCHRAGKPCVRRPAQARAGYYIHDFNLYQLRRAEILKRGRIRAHAGRQGGLKSGISRKQVAQQMLEAKRTPNPNPNPNPKETEAGGKKQRSRGERPPTPGAQQLVAEFVERFEAMHGEKPHVTSRDYGIAHRLVTAHGEAKAVEVLGLMFASADQWIAARHSLGTLSSQWNALVSRPGVLSAKTAGNAAAAREFVARRQG